MSKKHLVSLVLLVLVIWISVTPLINAENPEQSTFRFPDFSRGVRIGMTRTEVEACYPSEADEYRLKYIYPGWDMVYRDIEVLGRKCYVLYDFSEAQEGRLYRFAYEFYAYDDIREDIYRSLLTILVDVYGEPTKVRRPSKSVISRTKGIPADSIGTYTWVFKAEEIDISLTNVKADEPIEILFQHHGKRIPALNNEHTQSSSSTPVPLHTLIPFLKPTPTPIPASIEWNGPFLFPEFLNGVRLGMTREEVKAKYSAENRPFEAMNLLNYGNALVLGSNAIVEYGFHRQEGMRLSSIQYWIEPQRAKRKAAFSALFTELTALYGDPSDTFRWNDEWKSTPVKLRIDEPGVRGWWFAKQSLYIELDYNDPNEEIVLTILYTGPDTSDFWFVFD